MAKCRHRPYESGSDERGGLKDKFGKGHVAVISFDAVTDPGEIALDLITLVS